MARKSTREINDRPLPQQNTLHRSVVKLLMEDYEAGASTYALAERYSVRRATVRDVLRREGIDPSARSHRSKFTPELTAELRQRYDAGATRRELAVLYGVSKSTIGRMLRLRQ
jgi:DNA invertase Pin-like site-specific DNA recombinase